MTSFWIKLNKMKNYFFLSMHFNEYTLNFTFTLKRGQKKIYPQLNIYVYYVPYLRICILNARILKTSGRFESKSNYQLSF